MLPKPDPARSPPVDMVFTENLQMFRTLRGWTALGTSSFPGDESSVSTSTASGAQTLFHLRTAATWSVPSSGVFRLLHALVHSIPLLSVRFKRTATLSARQHPSAMATLYCFTSPTEVGSGRLSPPPRSRAMVAVTRGTLRRGWGMTAPRVDR